VEARS